MAPCSARSAWPAPERPPRTHQARTATSHTPDRGTPAPAQAARLGRGAVLARKAAAAPEPPGEAWLGPTRGLAGPVGGRVGEPARAATGPPPRATCLPSTRGAVAGWCPAGWCPA